jgi:signal transduction histidine kinase
MPRAERRLAVATRVTPEAAVEITVKDNGTGIRPAEQARLFEPFYTTKSQGLGLGLTICSSIVKAHGGTLTVANGEDTGAVATCSLPMQEMLLAAQ